MDETYTVFGRPNLALAGPYSVFGRPNLALAGPYSVFGRPNPAYGWPYQVLGGLNLVYGELQEPWPSLHFLAWAHRIANIGHRDF